MSLLTRLGWPRLKSGVLQADELDVSDSHDESIDSSRYSGNDKSRVTHGLHRNGLINNNGYLFHAIFSKELQSYGYKLQKHCYKTLLQLQNIDKTPTHPTQLIKD